jgi:UDP-2-acetamido-2,6-beta-L-arabino-hexul-4-ose reductase
MRVVLTGAHGFLGWHLRSRLRATTAHQVVALGRGDGSRLDAELRDADAVIHLAGVNRGPDEDVEFGNVQLARDVADAVRRSPKAPRIVFANSIQAGNDTPYGRSKARARDILAASAERASAPFADVVLPNLFGEHGRPDYNSFVATFAHAAVDGRTPVIQDRPVRLLHAQPAAQLLIDALDLAGSTTLRPEGEPTTVARVWRILAESRHAYASGDIPPLDTQLRVDLFNTLRAVMFPRRYPIGLSVRRDHRGGLVECVRAHGGQGQSFVSTSAPGVTRGEHFHLGKIERFLVLRGRARIALRRLFSRDVVSFEVTGDEPAAVDMPTMWAHNITNVGDEELVTFFWTNELFDPDAPDTYPESVEPTPGEPDAVVAS